MSFAPVTRIGPYEVQTLLGAGGMGEVYRARDTRLQRLVALKVLRSDKVTDLDRQSRLLQEARAASALQHPHIVAVHDILFDQGALILVLEYVPGKTLDQLIPKK